MLDQRDRGKIFRVPEYSASLQEDPEAHRHVVLGYDSVRGQSLLVYGTSQHTHCADGAVCFLIPKPPRGPAEAQLTLDTHFLSSVIVRVPPAGLIRQKGYLTTSWLDPFIDRVHEGVGAVAPPTPSQSRTHVRGQVCRLKDAAKEYFRTRFALILTPRSFRREAQHHLIVPIYDARRVTQTQPHWVRIAAPWGPRVTNNSNTEAFWADPTNVSSVFAARHIDTVCPQFVASGELDTITAGLTAFLGLSPYIGVASGVRMGRCPVSEP